MTGRRTTVTDEEGKALMDALVTRRAAVARIIEALHGEASDAMIHRDLSDLYDTETVADSDIGPTLSIAAWSERSLAMYDEALARTGDGSYGRCSDCDGPITLERLQALPATPRCFSCSGQRSPIGREPELDADGFRTPICEPADVDDAAGGRASRNL